MPPTPLATSGRMSQATQDKMLDLHLHQYKKHASSEVASNSVNPSGVR
jgi:hypothetical protein